MALLTFRLRRPWIAIAAIWAGVWVAPAAEQRTSTAEDDIKAAFLFNFTQFVEWPGGDTQEPFRICVVADTAFTAALDRTVHGESVGHRPIARTTPLSPEGARVCQILFLGRQDDDAVERWVTAVKGLPVLVVGESRTAWTHGAHVNFVVENNRVKFDVNNESAARTGLTISSKLLRVARNVTARNEQ